MNGGASLALAGAAASLGLLHSLAPDHWVPFAALGRARSWSATRTAAVTLLCGLGHVGVSVVLGLLGLALGVGVLEAFGHRLGSLAGLSLIAFGALYALWGLHRATSRRLPGVGSEPNASQVAVSGLFVLFALDPCVPLIPLVAAAAPLGWGQAATVMTAYGMATLLTMAGMAVSARLGAGVLQADWMERWGHAAAGALILLAGIAVRALGI